MALSLSIFIFLFPLYLCLSLPILVSVSPFALITGVCSHGWFLYTPGLQILGSNAQPLPIWRHGGDCLARIFSQVCLRCAATKGRVPVTSSRLLLRDLVKIRLTTILILLPIEPSLMIKSKDYPKLLVQQPRQGSATSGRESSGFKGLGPHLAQRSPSNEASNLSGHQHGDCLNTALMKAPTSLTLSFWQGKSSSQIR